MSHPWCLDPSRDEAVRAAEDGRDGPLPTLEEAIAQPFAEAAKCSPAVSESGEGQSGMQGNVLLSIKRMFELIDERDAAIRERDAHKEEYYKLRGERITQDLTADRFAAAVQEADRLRARVAELEQARERFDTALEEARTRSGVNDLILQRDEALEELDAAIRERDELRVKRDELQTGCNRLNASLWKKNAPYKTEMDAAIKGLERAQRERDDAISEYQSAANERDALRVRVASLESQLESVACRAAAAETALEAAPAANDDGGLSPHACGVLRELRDAAVCLPHCGGERLQRAIAAAKGLLTQPRPAVPASGAAGAEADAWGVRRNGLVDSVAHRSFRSRAEHSAEQWGGTVVPLYAAPQPAKGWLTPEEREAIEWAADAAYDKQHPAERDAAIRERDTLREERDNGTELGHLLRSAQVTIPQELAPLDHQCRKYAAGWNDCLHNVKAMLAGKITVNQQTGTIKVRSVDGVKETEK